MGCARAPCSAEQVFVFINIAFAMYAGALLATAARLAWDPSTYAWFRFLCAAQYRVSAGAVLAAGLWLALLAALAVAPAARTLHLYAALLVALVVAELAYAGWMAASLAAWWRTAPQAELARRGLDLLHDLKPALLAVDHYRDIARPVYEMIEEVEREAPNNAIVIVLFGAVGAALQVAAFVMARRLARVRARAARRGPELGLAPELSLALADEKGACDLPAPSAPSPAGDVGDTMSPGWRRKANLQMYTILEKIF